MSDDIRPGDVVVCVGRDPECPDKCRARKVGRARMFRVSEVVMDPSWLRSGLWLFGLPTHPEDLAWCICGFRKIDAPDTELSRQIRACKPIREREST